LWELLFGKKRRSKIRKSKKPERYLNDSQDYPENRGTTPTGLSINDCVLSKEKNAENQIEGNYARLLCG